MHKKTTKLPKNNKILPWNCWQQWKCLKIRRRNLLKKKRKRLSSVMILRIRPKNFCYKQILYLNQLMWQPLNRQQEHKIKRLNWVLLKPPKPSSNLSKKRKQNYLQQRSSKQLCQMHFRQVQQLSHKKHLHKLNKYKIRLYQQLIAHSHQSKTKSWIKSSAL
jgi:hypothetical protein